LDEGKDRKKAGVFNEKYGRRGKKKRGWQESAGVRLERKRLKKRKGIATHENLLS